MKRLGAVLDANIDVVELFLDHLQGLCETVTDLRSRQIEVKNIRRQLTFYRERIHDMAELAHQCANLVS